MALKLAQHSRVAVVGALAVALALTGCSSEEEGFTLAEEVGTLGGDATAEIDAAVDSAMQLSHSSQAIVGVWGADGEYLHGYGGVSGGAQFRAAQTTQPFLCALLLDAVAEGELALDRNVQADIPRQTRLDDVTYAQLCTQRSGLADFKKSIADSTVNNPTRVWPEQELIAQGMARSPKSWPGLNFHRSDTNSVVLGRALKVSHDTTLQQLLDERVFDVAGMTGSYVPRADSLTIPDGSMTAHTFPSKNDKPDCKVDIVQVDEVSPSMLASAGNTVTTASDIKNFYEAYFSGTFGPEGASALPTTVEPTENPKRDKNGDPKKEPEEPGEGDLLWGFGTEKIGPLYGLAGDITGTISAAYHDPDSGYTVVVALNNSSAGADFAKALALEIAAISGPEVPWSAEDQAKALSKAAVCQ